MQRYSHSCLEIANYPNPAKAGMTYRMIVNLLSVYIVTSAIYRLGVGTFIISQVFGDTSNK
ncbi:MAG: hypothetical protein LBI60_06180 [Bacteroidales bacterium]|nr:hypothetical protein [Bacteroidales bacterium]